MRSTVPDISPVAFINPDEEPDVDVSVEAFIRM
jgi:hypothetical protein